MSLSQSKINSFLFCPYRFRLEYIDEIPFQKSDALTFGILAHKSFARLFLEKKKGMAKIFQELIAENQGNVDYSELIKIGKMMKLICADKNFPNITQVEQKFNVSLGGYVFSGIIDRVDERSGKKILVDYKTSGKEWQDDEKRLYGKDNPLPKEKLVQAVIYASAYEEITGCFPSFEYLILTKHEETRKQIIPVSREEITENWGFVMELVEKMANSISLDLFEAKIGEHCHWCFFKKSCDFFRGRT